MEAPRTQVLHLLPRLSSRRGALARACVLCACACAVVADCSSWADFGWVTRRCALLKLSQQAALKREKDSTETWKQFFRRALGRHPRLDFHPTPASGLHFPTPVQLVHTQLYMRNSTRSSVIFFRVMVSYRPTLAPCHRARLIALSLAGCR
jgi:hypothetical protein